MPQKAQTIRKILQFRQTTRQTPIQYTISPLGISGEAIGRASAADGVCPELTIDETTYRLDLSAGGDGMQQSAAILNSDGEAIGSIVPWARTSKSPLARSENYDYRVLTIDNGTRLFVYEVGNDQGHFWCVYEDDERMVATIRKTAVTRDSLDVYELYLNRTDLAAALSLLALYLDATAYARVDENGFNREGTLTTAKALLRKYDPDFIQRITAELETL